MTTGHERKVQGGEQNSKSNSFIKKKAHLKSKYIQ